MRINLSMLRPSRLKVLTAAGFLLALTASSQTNTFPSTGNVGIGTSTPSLLLDVNGNSIFRNSLTLDFGTANRYAQLKDDGLYLSRTSDGVYSSTIKANSSMFYNTPDNHVFYSDGAEVLSINNGGKVGIGTSAPEAYLHVKAPSGQPVFRISNDTYKTDFIQDAYTTTIKASAHFNLYWGSAAAPSLMRLDGVSNAKFYLSNPYGAFVNGYGGFRVGMSEKFGFFTLGSTYSYDAIGAVYQDNSNIGLSFFAKYEGVSAEAARFSKAGNLLIGATADNDNKLQVNGNIWSTGLVLPTDAAEGKVLTSDADGHATWQTPAAAGWSYNGDPVGALKNFGTTDNYALPFITNNVERMRIGSNGNVGIGTVDITDAGYHLFVEKGIRTRKVKVDAATWADYVFDSSYLLRTLPELERFIRTHRRLPEMPSAKEVEKDGFDLGNNQIALLKKVEELTLYIIQQNKQLAEQEERGRRLSDRLSALEKEMQLLKDNRTSPVDR